MSLIRLSEIANIEIPLGNVSGRYALNKYGRSTNVDNGTDTDIWDGANASDNIAIWIAPTTARLHDIASSSASDDGNPVGVGARTLRIWGLTGWGTAEVSEDITMNGTTNVVTSNAYVIIHRMRVLTKGATNVNVGQIEATAQTDGTITAMILAGFGSTQMIVYGVPSTQTLLVTRLYANFNRSFGATGAVDMAFLYNPEPDAELLNFVTRHTFAIVSDGTSAFTIPYQPYKKFDGPGILKIQGNGSRNNLDVSAGFDGFLIDN